MEALEFVTKIKDKNIPVSAPKPSALEINESKEIRVLVLIEIKLFSYPALKACRITGSLHRNGGKSGINFIHFFAV